MLGFWKPPVEMNIQADNDGVHFMKFVEGDGYRQKLGNSKAGVPTEKVDLTGKKIFGYFGTILNGKINSIGFHIE